jgi:UDP-N-acetylmuramate dehydrogenase
VTPPSVEKSRSLKELNWWKVGGTAEYFAAPSSIDELGRVWQWAVGEKLPVHVVSGGSNVLVPDGVLRGLTVSVHGLNAVEKIEKIATSGGDFVELTALAGTPKSEIARYFLKEKLAPAIFLTGIPGDMGAGVVMNAGIGEARTPREFCEIVSAVDVMKPPSAGGAPKILTYTAAQIKWEYRKSSGWQPGIIVRVKVKWPMAPDSAVNTAVREQTRKRVNTQPLDLPNCGSVFRNPIGHKAAQLIEGAGLKGFRIGGASVSTKHANFIVNDRSASSADILAVIEHVRGEVYKKTGVQLETEVVRLGAAAD